MMMMSRRALILMALFLAAATTAAAATAFAGETNDLRSKVGQSVADGVYTSNDASRKAKVMSFKPVRSTNGAAVVRPPKR